MPKIARALAVLALALAGPLAAPSAQAQPARVFVGAQGSDANPCTFAMPCRTFQHAHDTVAAGGEIDVLDPAGYGAVTISKAISVQGHGFAGIAIATGATGITISAGLSDQINLRGLLLDGAADITGSFGGLVGLAFNGGASLSLQGCVIRHLKHSGGTGINFVPPATSSLFVSDTLISDNSNGTGIQINQSASSNVLAVLNRVELNNNYFGVRASGGGSSGTLNVSIVDSVVAG